ncbi:MAG: hypothetical protein ACP5MV_03935 [Candidatus Parvarchaeum sp.]
MKFSAVKNRKNTANEKIDKSIASMPPFFSLFLSHLLLVWNNLLNIIIDIPTTMLSPDKNDTLDGRKAEDTDFGKKLFKIFTPRNIKNPKKKITEPKISSIAPIMERISLAEFEVGSFFIVSISIDKY